MSIKSMENMLKMLETILWSRVLWRFDSLALDSWHPRHDTCASMARSNRFPIPVLSNSHTNYTYTRVFYWIVLDVAT